MWQEAIILLPSELTDTQRLIVVLLTIHFVPLHDELLFVFGCTLILLRFGFLGRLWVGRAEMGAIGRVMGPSLGLRRTYFSFLSGKFSPLTCKPERRHRATLCKCIILFIVGLFDCW